MGAKSKPLDNLSLSDLGISGAGGDAAGQKVVAVEAAPAREAGEIVQDEGDAAKKIVEFLASKKVI